MMVKKPSRKPITHDHDAVQQRQKKQTYLKKEIKRYIGNILNAMDTELKQLTDNTPTYMLYGLVVPCIHQGLKGEKSCSYYVLLKKVVIE